MPDFARGWTLSSIAGAGAAASITVPATPGVVHILDSLLARLISAAAGAGGGATQLQVVTDPGVVLATDLGPLVAGAGNDSISLSGLDIAASAGSSLIVRFTVVVPAAFEQDLVIQGHDI